MTVDFDQVTDRRAVQTVNKWTFYPPDVLPLWIADMDFRTPQPILAALQRALDHGILGYELPAPALFDAITAQMDRLYGWKIAPEMIIPVPGVGVGMAAAMRALSAPGDGILVQPPIFPAFIQLPEALGRRVLLAGLKPGLQPGGHWRYEPDPEAFRAAIAASPAPPKLFLLCNPHNPSGRVFTRPELASMADICLEHGLLICADEIHQGILLDGARHIPIASLSPEIDKITLTFIGPGKTFNMSGLHCAFAVIPDPALRAQVSAEVMRSVIEVNGLGLAAAGAAYSGACDGWLAEARQYLRANRDFAVRFIQQEMPGLRSTVPEGTYLLWIDCREALQAGRIQGSPQAFFLEQAKTALTDGAEFGPGGAGFVRLNFACPRATLLEGLTRMKTALGY